MKVMISAGEASGDIHAANLVDALEKVTAADAKLPDATQKPIEVFGMGGARLAASGMEILVDVEKHAVMGLLEVLHKYPSLRANLTTLRKAMVDRKPDILVLVDYPHFNMKLAATAQEHGIPVLFFIAPKVWASRPGRTTELKKLVDHMALILPFEKKIFDDAEIPCTYVGNPLLDNEHLVETANSSIPAKQVKRIALLPGSRKSEIAMLLPPMLETTNKLTAQFEDIEFVIPVAETIDHQQIEKTVSEYEANIQLIKPTDYKQLRSCDAALVASGTATLELAILGIPMVVVYKLKPLSYKVLKRWLTIEHISLVNIIADKYLVPELLQDDVTPDKLFTELSTLLTDDKAKKQQLTGLASVHKQIGLSGASCVTAELIVSMVRKHLQSQNNTEAAI